MGFVGSLEGYLGKNMGNTWGNHGKIHENH
jgi:hypothetical protein